MIILDEPFVSYVFLDWLKESQHPVLDNDFARNLLTGASLPSYYDGNRVIVHDVPRLNIVDHEEAVQRINAGERVYTCCENALSWIDEHTDNENLKQSITACKDKALFRKLTKDVPGSVKYFEATLPELLEMEFDQLGAPCVIKPTVGFCSVGVHIVQELAHWEEAKALLRSEAERAATLYPESVVNSEMYIVEELVEGTEMAVEAYFDAAGSAHVLNLFVHEFDGPEDTSDRLYITSKELIRKEGQRFAAWLDQINQPLGMRDFCVHPEVRVAPDGTIRTIEFNPLRFAGMGGADCCWHSYGFRNYEEYLSGNERGVTAEGDLDAEVEALFGNASDDEFAMSYIGCPSGADLQRGLDISKFCEKLPGLKAFYALTPSVHNGYGFAFVASQFDDDGQFDHLLRAPLKNYLE